MVKYLSIFAVCFICGFLLWQRLLSPLAPDNFTQRIYKIFFDLFDNRPVEQRYVTLNLSGGLGNRMFQYASAYAYGKEHYKTVVVAGGSEIFERAFGIHLNLLDKNDVRFFPAMPAIRRKTISATMHMGNGGNFLSNPDIIMMHGYFQNEKFFKKYAAAIRKLFTFKGGLSPENKKLLALIKGQNAVSVHIRRTDYVNSGYYYVLSVGYYKRAMKYMAAHVDKPHFYIFSDDISWVENNMEFNYPHTFVKTNRGNDSYLDMWLMSECKHNIIANSTFSWWGAWLNKNPEKIVIAPDVWGFSTDPYEKTQKLVNEIVPKEWIIISNIPKGEED